MVNNSPGFLFAMGCPRSGTTALWKLLIADPRIVLGVERYGRLALSPASVSKAHFEYSRFFDVRPGDTFYDHLVDFNPYYQTARESWHTARYHGDKVPLLFKQLPVLENKFPQAKKLVIVRNIYSVASSHLGRLADPVDTWRRGVPEAVRDWNWSLRTIRDNRNREDFYFVHYEELFIQGVGLERLFSFLDLEVNQLVSDQYEKLLAIVKQKERNQIDRLSKRQRTFIRVAADFRLYKSLSVT